MSKLIDADTLADRLRVEFKDDAQDRLEVIQSAIDRLRAASLPETDGAVILQREVSKLRGIGSAFGYPLVSLIAQRMEAYLAQVVLLEERELRDLMVFADRITMAVEREEKPDVPQTNAIIKSLPVRYEFDITDVEVHDVEIMLVTPSKVVARLLTAEMGACGFRAHTIHDPLAALTLAIQSPPDMVIASAVMDGLSGTNLIRALKAITTTSSIPMAVLTSLDTVPDAPDEAAIIRVGAPFGEDFAEAITRFNLG